MKADALAELERVGEAVGRDLPLGGDVADDLRVAVRVELEQRAVDGRHQLDVGEGALLVGVEAGRVGADHREQDAPAARGVRGPHTGRGQREHGGDAQRESNRGEQRVPASDSSRHLTPPGGVERSTAKRSSTHVADPTPARSTERTLPGGRCACQQVGRR